MGIILLFLLNRHNQAGIKEGFRAKTGRKGEVKGAESLGFVRPRIYSFDQRKGALAIPLFLVQRDSLCRVSLTFPHCFSYGPWFILRVFQLLYTQGYPTFLTLLFGKPPRVDSSLPCATGLSVAGFLTVLSLFPSSHGGELSTLCTSLLTHHESRRYTMRIVVPMRAGSTLCASLYTHHGSRRYTLSRRSTTP